jgi:hypothetical protein
MAHNYMLHVCTSSPSPSPSSSPFYLSPSLLPIVEAHSEKRQDVPCVRVPLVVLLRGNGIPNHGTWGEDVYLSCFSMPSTLPSSVREEMSSSPLGISLSMVAKVFVRPCLLSHSRTRAALTSPHCPAPLLPALDEA